MVNNSDLRLAKSSLNGHNSQGITLAQPESPLSRGESSGMFETRRQHVMNTVTINQDGFALKHMDELLAKLKFEDMIDDEVQVVPSPVVKLPWISPHTSKLLNESKVET
ncbi:uncharacterized protein C8R40DRAFT_1177747 [Lentinula edodes]|uniref:uncharacterized protein n=1 Tax=Lentinula edodes TaxID=5353 RepID=UPI001E8D0F17|nr:uncharacterized protein C8R40DRAFT_1177747 [Lentinula edodes]KAH7868485.1 hypothetical protein C8R40DRAFT_1177747 [Lentinula edodes]